MTLEPTPLSLSIASQEPAQATALAEMLRELRPGWQPQIHDASKREVAEQVELVLVVEQVASRGELAARMRERYPNAMLLLIAPIFDEQMITVAASVRAAAILASPCEPAALDRVLTSLQRKLRFSGRCGGIEISELLRLHAHANSNGILHLRASEATGAIYLEDGQPVHAHCGALRGAEAVRAMLDWTDATANWLEGRSGSAVTIVGQIEGLLEQDVQHGHADYELMQEAPREILERVDHIAATHDILGAFLLRNTEVVYGRCDASLQEPLIIRALSGLARVFLDMEDQQGELASSEIQAMVGEHRLVVDRVGPARLGFQVGVVVRQAAPICKSLRRLLRQVDRLFRRTLAERGRLAMSSASPKGSTSSPKAAHKAAHKAPHKAKLNRVA